MSASNEGSRAVRMLDDATVETLARHWQDGWNRGDLETIMAPFAPDVVFSSPGISMMTGDPAKTTIEGADALRAYVDAALRRTRGIRYTLQAKYAGVDSVVLVYTCSLPDGAQTPGADLMRIDSDGSVVEWRCHY
ncbi:MAG TPA: nuclear transport factor 2 family protein [Acidimicrobiia bacterium]